MKQLFLSLIGVVIFIIAVGILTQKTEKGEIKLPNLNNELKKGEITVGKKKLTVEIADTESLRKTGLSKKTNMTDSEAMLFVFDQKNISVSFWMKDMIMPIDIFWIDDDKIVQIDKNVQPPKPGTHDSDLKVYKPKTTIDYVLETKAGFSDRFGIREGTLVNLEGIKK